jgi:DNA-3-methyladenine glycosylase I
MGEQGTGVSARAAESGRSARATESGEDDDGTVVDAAGTRRCGWCAATPEYVAYHDDEWGRPVVDDVRLYEKLCLEGFQSGLSWLTILRKRPAFRAAFAGFDPAAVARFGDQDVARLLADAGIVRHRGKIEAAIANARATVAVQDEIGSLAALVWSFEPDRADRPVPRRLGEIAATTPASTALAKELRRRGFRFVGPTTAYAAMQSLGLVNDHLAACASRAACEDDRRTTRVPGSR